MATLKNNGNEIGRIETLSRTFSYRSNGKVLVKHCGSSWKQCDNGRRHADIEKVYREDKARRDGRPGPLKEWEQYFCDLFGPRDRMTAKVMFDLLSDDADGLCSELQDNGVEVCLDEVVELCQLWDVWLKYRETCEHKVTATMDGRTTLVAICSTRERAKKHAADLLETEKARGYCPRIRYGVASKMDIEVYLAYGSRIID